MLPDNDNDPPESIVPTSAELEAKASIDAVAEKILADFPGADPTLWGDSYSAHGSISWAPRRDPSVDFSDWGDWEAWEFCNGVPQPNGKTIPVPTGGWIAWNAATGAQRGFEPKVVLSARRQAEMLAVAMNDGRPTRVVHKGGAWQRAQVTAADVKPLLDAFARDGGGCRSSS